MDVAHGEMVEKQLDALIQRRARKGDVDPDEREALWQASVRAYEEKRRQELDLQRYEYHRGQAARLRTALGSLIRDHEQNAKKYLPKGA
jgi:hypothetical protein